MYFLGYHNRLTEELSDRLIEILDIGRHVCRSYRFPCFFYHYHLADAFQAAHFVDEQLHDDDGRDWEQDWMVLDGVNLENDEPLVQQVKLLV